MKKTLILLFFAILWHSAEAQESQTLYNFLRLPASSHAAALGGEDVTTIEDDASLMFHNPALLQSVSDDGLSLGYMNYMSGINAFSASYAYIYNPKATIGIAAQYLNYGTMKETNSEGTVIGDFNASDLAVNAVLSYTLAPRLVGGVTARFIYSSIGGYRSTAAGIDLGLNYYNEEKDLSASIVAKNLGGQLSAYDDEYESMPADLKMGVTKRLIGTPLRFTLTASDLIHWDYSFFRHLTLGADIILTDQIYLAAGYNFRRAHEMGIANKEDSFNNNESSHGAGLSFGGGIQLERFNLHVSYGKYHVSGSSLLFNLGIKI